MPSCDLFLFQVGWLVVSDDQPSPIGKLQRMRNDITIIINHIPLHWGRGSSGRGVWKTPHTHTHTYAHTHWEENLISVWSTECLFIMCSLLIHVLLHLSISFCLSFSRFFPRSPFRSLVLWPLPLLWLQECKKHIWNLLERRKGENGMGDGKREQGKMRRLTKEWKAKWGPEQGALPQNHFWKVWDERCRSADKY